jgi:hypothetical protein
MKNSKKSTELSTGLIIEKLDPETDQVKGFLSNHRFTFCGVSGKWFIRGAIVDGEPFKTHEEALQAYFKWKTGINDLRKAVAVFQLRGLVDESGEPL